MPNMGDLPLPHACSRRSFLRAGGGLAIASHSLPPFLGAGHAREPDRRAGQSLVHPARSCILVYLLGGPPHLDMWDLKPGAPAEIRGPFKPIATSVPGLQSCEHLPRL